MCGAVQAFFALFSRVLPRPELRQTVHHQTKQRNTFASSAQRSLISCLRNHAALLHYRCDLRRHEASVRSVFRDSAAIVVAATASASMRDRPLSFETPPQRPKKLFSGNGKIFPNFRPRGPKVSSKRPSALLSVASRCAFEDHRDTLRRHGHGTIKPPLFNSTKI